MAHSRCALLILAARRKSVWPRLACDTGGDTLGCSACFAAWVYCVPAALDCVLIVSMQNRNFIAGINLTTSHAHPQNARMKTPDPDQCLHIPGTSMALTRTGKNLALLYARNSIDIIIPLSPEKLARWLMAAIKGEIK